MATSVSERLRASQSCARLIAHVAISIVDTYPNSDPAKLSIIPVSKLSSSTSVTACGGWPLALSCGNGTIVSNVHITSNEQYSTVENRIIITTECPMKIDATIAFTTLIVLGNASCV